MEKEPMITLRSIYNPWGVPYTKRFLIERQWPRDPDRPALHFEGWLRDVAPSEELCAWFANDRRKWQEFRKRYFAELDSHPEAWEILLEEARHGAVELLYNSHDPRCNNALALKEYLEAKLSEVPKPVRTVTEHNGTTRKEL
jgi:uncharacterized protein YeaO (DUF488 family)